jgi:DnaK suppressor protein
MHAGDIDGDWSRINVTAASGKASKKTATRKKATAARKRTAKAAAAEDGATPEKPAAAKKKTATKKAAAKKKTAAKKPAHKGESSAAAAAKSAPGEGKKKPPTKAAPKAPAATGVGHATTPGRRVPSTTRASGARSTSKSNDNSYAIAPPPPKPDARLVGGIIPYTVEAGEEYMNERQLEHFRNILQAWKRDLMEEVDRTVDHMKDEAANFPDPNDRATQESEFSLELRTRDRERKLIKKIDEALGVVDAHEYGYCDTCGIEIGIRRLEARPTATLCIDCKTLDEIRERQMG